MRWLDLHVGRHGLQRATIKGGQLQSVVHWQARLPTVRCCVSVLPVQDMGTVTGTAWVPACPRWPQVGCSFAYMGIRNFQTTLQTILEKREWVHLRANVH